VVARLGHGLLRALENASELHRDELHRGAKCLFDLGSSGKQSVSEHRALRTSAERRGTTLALMENLYAFRAGATTPMREESPLHPTGPKGAVRAEMATELMEARNAAPLRIAIVRPSDFYGPEVRNSALDQRVVRRHHRDSTTDGSATASSCLPHLLAASDQPKPVRWTDVSNPACPISVRRPQSSLAMSRWRRPTELG